VISCGRNNAEPGPDFGRLEIIPEGFTRPSDLTAARFYIDDSWIETMEITVMKGRNFSDQYTTDQNDGLIINETLLKKANFTDGIGRRIDIVDERGEIYSRTVLGIVKDFHFSTPRQKSEAMFFQYDPRRSPVMNIKISPNEFKKTVSRIEEMYQEIYPGRQFNPEFLDQAYDNQFDQDRDFMRNIGIFAAIGIFIACLGLIGLVAFSIEQRKKEIAIRKVLGSGEGKIFHLLIRDYLKWVVFANLFAWPGAYFAMNTWLNDFTFRVPFKLWPFILSSFIALFIALFTISYQTLRATQTNPACALRQIY